MHAHGTPHPATPGSLHPSPAPRPIRPYGRSALAAEPSAETLPDWQVALLLGGGAVAGLASTVAALFGVSLLL